MGRRTRRLARLPGLAMVFVAGTALLSMTFAPRESPAVLASVLPEAPVVAAGPEPAPVPLEVAPLEAPSLEVGPPPPPSPPRARFAQSRVVSLYGFPGVPVMGALGDGTPDEVAARAVALVREHEASAPGVDVVGAFHLIVAVAEVAPGADGTYLGRLDPVTIESYVAASRKHGLLVYLDIQIGWADPLVEVQRLERFLREPDVQVALDPEFSTRKSGAAPGKVIGALAAAEVNRVQRYLAALVSEHGLPPKMLVLHQFTDGMLPDAEGFEAVPEVEIAIDMDGYGSAGSKLAHYERYSLATSAERPAIKLFYNWDTPLLTAEQLSSLPVPPGLVIYQ